MEKVLLLAGILAALIWLLVRRRGLPLASRGVREDGVPDELDDVGDIELYDALAPDDGDRIGDSAG